MISLRNRTWQEPKRQHSWGAGAVDFQITDEQRSVLQPTQDELMEGAILKEIGVAKCSRRMARRRMNNMGEVNNHSVWANDPQRLGRMQNALDLAVTLGDMNEARAKTKAAATQEKVQELQSHHANAISKLQDVGVDGAASLTVKQISSVLLHDFGVSVSSNAKKSVLVETLQAAASRADWSPPERQVPAPPPQHTQPQQPAGTNIPQPSPQGPSPNLTLAARGFSLRPAPARPLRFFGRPAALTSETNESMLVCIVLALAGLDSASGSAGSRPSLSSSSSSSQSSPLSSSLALSLSSWRSSGMSSSVSSSLSDSGRSGARLSPARERVERMAGFF